MNVIILFPKIEGGNNIKKILQQRGYTVQAVCTTGAQALLQINRLEGGIIVCGSRFVDMVYEELLEYLPKEFEMLLVAPAAICDERENSQLNCVKTPLKVQELLDGLEKITQILRLRKKQERRKPKRRSDEERILIEHAKGILMQQKNYSEEEAHRYIQKSSMENGTGLIETAQMIIQLYE